MNLGPEVPPPSEGLLTTVAWDLGTHAPPDGDGFLRARGRRLFLRRHDPVAPRRAGAHRPSGRGRPTRSRNPQQRRRLPCPRLYRPRQPVVGPRGAAARSSASRRAPDGRTSPVRPSRPSPISAATCSTQWATLPAGQSANCAPTVAPRRWTSFCNSKPIRQASRSPAPGRPRSRHWAPQCWQGSPKESGGRSRTCRPSRAGPRCSSLRRDVAGLTPTTPAGSRRSGAPGTGREPPEAAISSLTPQTPGACQPSAARRTGRRRSGRTARRSRT